MKKLLCLLLVVLSLGLFYACGEDDDGENGINDDYSDNDSQAEQDIYHNVTYYYFDVNEPQTIEVIDGDFFIVELPTTNYVFLGWFYDEEFSERFYPETTPIKSPLTLYSQWIMYDAGIDLNLIDCLSVTQLPDKTEFFVDEEIVFENHIVSFVLNDGTEEVLNEDDYWIIIPEIDGVGSYSVDVFTEHFSAFFWLTIKEYSVIEIALSSQPIKTVFFEDEIISLEGIEVVGIYENGIEVVLNETDYSIIEPEYTIGSNDVCIQYLDFNLTFNIDIILIQPNEIFISTPASKLSFFTNEAFHANGLELSIQYNNGSSNVLPIGSYELTVPSLTTAGAQNVTISYQGFQTSYQIEVVAVYISEIRIIDLPFKMEYYEGDTFNNEELDPLSVAIFFNNPNMQGVQIFDYEITPPDISTAGDKEVVISFLDTSSGNTLSTTYTITVLSLEVESLKLNSLPNKLIYYADEPLALEGLEVLVEYNSGKQESINDYEHLCDMNSNGMQPVEIRYLDKAVSFNIEIIGIDDIIIAGEYRNSFYVDDEFDSQGLIVYLLYQDGYQKEISDYYLTPPILDTIGVKDVEIDYRGFAATYQIEVINNDIVQILISTHPSKLTYYAGEQIDFSGMVVMAEYSSGELEEVLSYTVDSVDMSESGAKTIIIRYLSFNTSYEIHILPLVILEIEITKTPLKTSYYINESLETNGLKVSIVYNNGTRVEITDYTCSVDMTTSGTKNVLVEYLTFSTSFQIVVSSIPEFIESIEIVTLPTKLTYEIGAFLDTSGMVVKAIFNTGKEELVTTYTIDPIMLDTNGTKTVTIRYQASNGTFTDTFEITVISAVDIELVGEYKTIFYVGDPFNSNGLTVNLLYSNGTKKQLQSFDITTPDMSTAGTKTIAVSHLAFTKSYEIQVLAVVIEGLEVTRQPNKTIYYVGDALKLTGAIVSLSYNNGRKDQVEFSYIEPDMGTGGDKQVIVSYGQYSTSFNITVIGIQGITLSGSYKTSFVEGEMFNSTGLIVIVVYEDSTTKQIGDYVINVPNTTVVGKADVRVSYFDADTSYEITIIAKYSSLIIKSLPAKTVYYMNEELDITGIIVCAVLAFDLSEESVAINSLSFSSLDSMTQGNKTITVGYKYLTAQFDVVVLGYVQNECFDFVLNEDNQSYSIRLMDGKDVPSVLELPTQHYNLPITKILPNAFSMISNLTEVIIPDGYVAIGEGAFADNAILSKVRIPASVIDIGERAFYNCTSLNRVMFDARVDGINIRASSFEGISPTIVISVDSSNLTLFHSIIALESLAEYIIDLDASDYSVAKFFDDDLFVGLELFNGQEPLLYLSLTASNKSLLGWYDNSEFSGEPISFPYTLSGDVVLYAKWDESQAMEEVIVEGNFKFTLNSDNISYSVAASDAAAFSYNTIIPNSINGFPVTEIASGGFQGVALNRITIPSSIIVINQNAFNSSTVCEVIFEDGSQLTIIDAYAFANTRAFSTDFVLYLPDSLIRIENHAFENSIIKHVVIGVGITYFGLNAFRGCYFISFKICAPVVVEIESPNDLIISEDFNVLVPASIINAYRVTYEGTNVTFTKFS